MAERKSGVGIIVVLLTVGSVALGIACSSFAAAYACFFLTLAWAMLLDDALQTGRDKERS